MSDSSAVTMIIAVLLCVSLAISIYKRSRQEPIVEIHERTIVDSVAVKTLNEKISQMQRMLDAKPEVVVIDHYIDGGVTVDTVTVYPAGKKNVKRNYPYNVTLGGDSLSLVVNTDLYATVYTDINNRFYYEDSLRVWLSNVDLKRTVVYPVKKKTSNLFIMGGASYCRHNRHIGGYDYQETNIVPSIGVGYIHNLWGGYANITTNGIGAGVSFSISEAIKKIAR